MKRLLNWAGDLITPRPDENVVVKVGKLWVGGIIVLGLSVIAGDILHDVTH